MAFKLLDWRKERLKHGWVSRKYRNEDGDVVHDLRCDICGRWYNYSHKDIEKIMQEGRWNVIKKRPHHCGKQHCWDYFERYMIAQKKKALEHLAIYNTIFKK